MTEAIPEQVETIRDGGFRIEISPSHLRVTLEKGAFAPKKWSRVRWILRGILMLSVMLVLILDLSTSFGREKIPFLLFVVLMFAFTFVFGTLKARNNIACTRDHLQVVRVIRGKTVGTWIFPRELVGQIRYLDLVTTRTGSIRGLVFNVEGQEVEVLLGLEIVEADRILKELSRLGYKIIRDVGMPMAVEMAQERRNSILG